MRHDGGSPNRLNRYLSGGHRGVDGWLAQSSAEMIAALASYQVENELTGAAGEIGVHHGKLFILLALTAGADEKQFAIDVFEKQELNLDNSGRGDRDLFYTNLRRNGIDPGDITVISESSLDVSGNDLVAAVGPVRMLSIDGGHTVECVLNDLAIADIALPEHGIVIMDDVFNSTWPAVVTGYAEYLLKQPRIIPFATSPNKVYAAPAPFAERYRDWLRTRFVDRFDRSDMFFGFPVDSYGTWSRASLPKRALRKVSRELRRAFG